MKLQILGIGCPKCKQLMANAEQAVREMAVDASVEKVEDLREIARFRVLSTPALAVDGEVRAAGKVLSPAEIKAILAQ